MEPDVMLEETMSKTKKKKTKELLFLASMSECCLFTNYRFNFSVFPTS